MAWTMTWHSRPLAAHLDTPASVESIKSIPAVATSALANDSDTALADAKLASAEPQSSKPQSTYVVASADPTAPLAEGTQDTSELNGPSPIPEPPAPRPDPVNAVAVLDECLDANVCVDRYLWLLYQRAPKLDAHIEHEKRKVVITTKKGKKRTVTRTFSRLVDEDFTWKDPKAADKSGKELSDYVIGGMDRKFKTKLFNVLHAAADAGFFPAITSGFRDDYRQSIASGLKAADNRSYHGGSLRGGYGHGVAADVVSVDGATRNARYVASERLWKWLDAHGQEFGIARPYMDHDPPHLAPVDGEEYAKHHPTPKAAPKIEQASSQAKKKIASSQSKKHRG